VAAVARPERCRTGETVGSERGVCLEERGIIDLTDGDAPLLLDQIIKQRAAAFAIRFFNQKSVKFRKAC
jgi:hypothetical protein